MDRKMTLLIGDRNAEIALDCAACTDVNAGSHRPRDGGINVKKRHDSARMAHGNTSWMDAGQVITNDWQIARCPRVGSVV